jgi:hypothetical protein
MAPGGGENDPMCGSEITANCWNGWEDYLISVSQFQNTSGPFYSFGVWVGTSFAAPLAAGMAAVEFPHATPADTIDFIRNHLCPHTVSGSASLPSGLVLPDGICF